MKSTPPRHHNNFDLLRFLAAILVFISHIFIIYSKHEPTIVSAKSSSIAIDLGSLGVSIFFAISGYLIAESWENTRQLLPFLKKRILRIYPALIANFLIVAYIIAPVTTSLTLPEYYHLMLPDIFRLLLHSLYFKMPTLPGIFTFTQSPYIVNLPLWTLTFEVLCYLIICATGIIFGTKKTIWLITIIFITAFYQKIFCPQVNGDLGLTYCAIFLIGSCFYLYKDIIKLKPLAALAFIIGQLIFSLCDIYFLPFYLISTTYLIFYLALNFKYLGKFAKYGDFSYGFYIYAWPIQITFAIIFNFTNFPVFIIASFITTLAFAGISWHLIEKPFLKLKYR